MNADALPSQQSARALVDGEPLAILPVLAHAAGRGALIFVGALMATGGKVEDSAKAAIGGAVVIELFVLLHEVRNATK